MHLLSVDIMLVIAFMTGSVLSHVENTRGTLANNSLEFKTSSTGEITTLIVTTSTVFHLEPDLHVPGNIIFSDHYAMRTTDGVTTTTIFGSTTSSGNTVALGQLARFGSIRGFRQLSPTRVVVVDYSYHCLRQLDRITLQTPWYAGYCGSRGYSQGTTSARFSSPYGIINDKKRARMLLVTDYNNDAIRHVHVTVGSGFSSVSQFYKSSTLDGPTFLTQDPLSGDLYITTENDEVFKLTYSSRALTLLAGSSNAFVDGDFASSRFNDPRGIVLIDNGRKLILTDRDNHRLRLLDLITRQTSSLCTGEYGHTDGEISSCTLYSPRSLMVLNNTLYVGEYQRIRMIQYSCVAMEYDVSPDTGLAVVEVPGLWGKTKLSLPPGHYPFYHIFSSGSCTVEYHVNDRKEIACPNAEIQKTASSDTGRAVVDVPLCGSRTGELSLPPGSHPLRITTEDFNCTVEYNVSDHRLRRRLVFQAQYDVQCESATGNIAESPLTLIVARHAFDYAEICDADCGRPVDSETKLACTNHTLTVVWPSNLTYTGEVNSIPAELDQRLTSRILAKGSALYLLLPEVNPPIAFPEQVEHGGYMMATLSSYCIGEGISYVKDTDSCGQTTDHDIPDM